jgi:Tol biopolymer transport system component
MKKLVFILMLGASMILGFPQSDATLEYTVLRLTDNEFRDYEPQINGNNDVVWHGNDGNDYEIYMYEWLLDQVRQITDNSYDDFYPKINNNGDVAWRQDDGTNMTILFYEKAEDTIREIRTSAKDSSWNTLVPFMNNNGDIVWHENTGLAYNIFFYDNSTENIFALTTDTIMDNYNPKINDSREIVWFRYYSDLILSYSDYHSILLYDTDLGSAEYIWSLQTDVGALETNIERHEPKISNSGNVIWRFYDEGLLDTEIYYYDLQAGEVLQLTDNFEYEVIPDINSDGDSVWREQFEEVMREDIIFYDHSTGERVNISDSENQPYQGPTMCRISDNSYVTFQAVELQMTSWNNEVYVWDGSEIINISNSPNNEYYPRINSQGSVVWTVDTAGEDDEIYLAYLPEEEEDGDGDGDSGEDGGFPDCFIATACYGSPMAEDVQVLRNFRDQYLMKNPAGRIFVRLYNRYGPIVADFIQDKESLKIIIRQFLRPIIWLVGIGS